VPLSAHKAQDKESLRWGSAEEHVGDKTRCRRTARHDDKTNSVRIMVVL
jgi:hypothetical protein